MLQKIASLMQILLCITWFITDGKKENKTQTETKDLNSYKEKAITALPDIS